MYQICLLYFPKMFKIIRFKCLRTKLLYLRGHYLGFLCISIPQNPLRLLVKLHWLPFPLQQRVKQARYLIFSLKYVNFNSLLLKLGLQRNIWTIIYLFLHCIYCVWWCTILNSAMLDGQLFEILYWAWMIYFQ